MKGLEGVEGLLVRVHRGERSRLQRHVRSGRVTGFTRLCAVSHKEPSAGLTFPPYDCAVPSKDAIDPRLPQILPRTYRSSGHSQNSAMAPAKSSVRANSGKAATSIRRSTPSGPPRS